MKTDPLIPVERIQRSIYLLRGEKVMLNADLAALYGVTTGNLNKAVTRNLSSVLHRERAAQVNAAVK